MLSKERESWWVTGLLPALAGGLALRAWYFLDLRVQPFFGYPIVDSLTFDRLAREILAGGGGEAFFRAPLYPYVLSLVYALTGGGQGGVVWLQFALGLAAIVPVYLLAERWFGRSTAFLTAWIAALYPLRIFFEGEILAVTLFGFLLAWGMWLLWTGSEEDSTRRLLWAGLVLGLAALTRPNILLAVPFLLAGVLLPRLRAREGLWLRLAGTVAVLAVTVAPATMHNWRAERKLIPVAANGGINFYLGNRPGATGETPLPPGLLWQDRVQEPIRAGVTGMWEQDRYWWDRSFAAIAADRSGWLRLLTAKSLLFWSAFESSNNKRLEHFAALSFPTRHYRGWFGVLVCLGFAGLFVLARGRPLFALVSLLAGYWLAVALFFVSARYRLPLVPFLAMAGAAAAVELAGSPGRGRRKRAALSVTAVLAAAAVFPSLIFVGGDRIDSDFQMGQVFLSRGEPDRAEAHLLRSMEEGKGNADVLNSLGAVSFSRREWKRAEEYYLSALEEGEFSEIYFNLGVVYERMEPPRRREALDAYRRALERNPLESRARANLEYLLGRPSR